MSGQIIIQRRDRYQARHRVIAERLVDQLSKDAARLGDLFERVAFAVSANVHARLPKSSASRRLLTTLLSSRVLFNRLDLERARSVYARVENNLHWDHHFWLQRGSLEVRDGDVRDAERFLDTALSLAPNDSFVLTEHAYMLLRKAVSDPTHKDAAIYFDEGKAILTGQAENRGEKDPYPYHVLGSQTLSWVRRAGLSTVERRALLGEVRTLVDSGAQRHPDLRNLARDLFVELA